MDDKMNNKYSRYDGLSTEALREILYQDSVKSGSDIDETLYLSALLARREQDDPAFAHTDAKTAWQSFNDNYRYASREADPEEEQVIPIESASKTVRPWVRRLIRIGIAAAIIAAALFVTTVTASAAGYDLWGTLATWTNETFGFKNRVSVSEATRKLQNTMEKHGITEFSAPTYLPADYKEAEFYDDDIGYGRGITAYYTNDSDNCIVIDVIRHDKPEGNGVYPKDEGDPEIFNYKGIDYYIMTNCDIYLAVWQINNVEGCVSGLQTKDELIKIIKSINVYPTADPSIGVLKEFQEALDSHEMKDFSAPSYIPKGYEQIDFSAYDLGSVSVISTFLSNGSESIILKYSTMDEKRTAAYNKDDQEPEVVEINGISFYIMTNSGKYLAVWRYGNMEGSVSELETRDELIRILDSIDFSNS